VDRGKPGSKYRLVVDRRSIPLAVRLPAANAHGATQLLPLIAAIPSIIGPREKPGRPRQRPAKLHADKAYDHSKNFAAPYASAVSPHAMLAAGSIPRSDRAGTAGR
jgi:hypothetical protein